MSGDGPQFELWGCDYCADPNNHLFGHVDQIVDAVGDIVLIRCPLGQTIYQPTDEGTDRFVRLTTEQAENVLPLRRWRVVPGGA